MSAMGHKRTWQSVWGMSALPPIEGRLKFEDVTRPSTFFSSDMLKCQPCQLVRACDSCYPNSAALLAKLDGKPSGSAVIFGRSPGPPNSSATSIWLRCDMQNHSRFKKRPAYGSNPSGSGLQTIRLALFVLPEVPTSPVRFFNVRRYPQLRFSGRRASNL